jgi:hypothetical protein
MVIVKECYAQCNEAKTQLTQDLAALRQEYSTVISSSSIVSDDIVHTFSLITLWGGGGGTFNLKITGMRLCFCRMHMLTLLQSQL